MDMMDYSLVSELIYKNSYLDNYLKKMLSYKDIVLIFSLVRTAFLSSYNNIVLIFSLLKIILFLLVLF